ncbi:CHAD domain-containing protein [Rhizobium sp. SL42]|uniref:CHAD domain-containing protein n=1 Tax=Rhizobium sp. SL42 TaxID=2806346 RepID=UPI001F2D0CCA|nr:CHAD domain-containing protein [Rhizobium sp. SL42]UJW74702.1 CHAD domain-containing protein [Rhizobium sp. SL42]
MPYRIRPDGDFASEVRQVASAQLQRAITSLEHQPDGLHEAIHDARKKFKRLRNLLRLVAIEDRETRRTENARLRDTARALSTVRDATALIESMAFLADHALNAEEKATVALARQALTERRDTLASQESDLAEKVSGAILECRASLVAFASLDLPSRPRPTARLLAKGWKKTLRKGHMALATCREEGHGEAFHDLRKAVQGYWMNLLLLRELWPSAFAAKRHLAKELVDILGHEHDLTLLIDHLDHNPDLLGSGEACSHLLAMIIRQQQELRRLGLDRAGKVFAEAPGTEAAIVAALWLEATSG